MEKTMKFLILLISMICLNLAAATHLSAQDSGATDAPKKILVAYFSHTLTTQNVAMHIQNSLPGADILRIETVVSYPDNYDAVVDIAKKELESQAKPALKPITADVSSYDVIFIGYPIWWRTIPRAVYVFLESYDLSGKTIVPFCTHRGSKISGTDKVIKDLVPNASVLKGLAVKAKIVTRNPDNGASKPVRKWLSSIGFKL